MAATGPIGSAERDLLLARVRLPVAVAVSGGADSTALMHLVAGWAAIQGRLEGLPDGVAPILVITVDHGLRPEAAAEAAWVAGEARRLGLAHVTLRWRGQKPRTAIQETARAARYALICEHIGREPLPKPRQVLLAHHQDDQAETVLMRLARGSGVDGLSGMREVEVRTWVHLKHPVEERLIAFVRPLLSVPKARLEATLQAIGAGWLRDPSNADQRYERVRLRAAVREREALGLTAEMLGLTAERIGSARAALERAHQELARTAVDLHDGAWASIDRQMLQRAPQEIALRLLQATIGAFGGQREPPSRLQMERLLERILARTTTAFTLGGAVVEDIKSSKRRERPILAIYREPGRRPLPKATLWPGHGLFWDRRFYISLSPGYEHPVRVEALGQTGFARLKRAHRSLRELGIPAAAAAALPAIWAGDRLLVVPCLSAAEPGLLGPVAEDGEPMVGASFAPQHIRTVLGRFGEDDI